MTSISINYKKIIKMSINTRLNSLLVVLFLCSYQVSGQGKLLRGEKWEKFSSVEKTADFYVAATFTYTEDIDLTLEVTSDEDNDSTWNVTWSNVTILEIAGGTEFIGIQDFTRKYLITDIGTDHVQIGMFISATDGTKMNYPSHMIRMTFVPKD